jgi:hypothetical protein
MERRVIENKCKHTHVPRMNVRVLRRIQNTWPRRRRRPTAAMQAHSRTSQARSGCHSTLSRTPQGVQRQRNPSLQMHPAVHTLRCNSVDLERLGYLHRIKSTNTIQLVVGYSDRIIGTPATFLARKRTLNYRRYFIMADSVRDDEAAVNIVAVAVHEVPCLWVQRRVSEPF